MVAVGVPNNDIPTFIRGDLAREALRLDERRLATLAAGMGGEVGNGLVGDLDIAVVVLTDRNCYYNGSQTGSGGRP